MNQVTRRYPNQGRLIKEVRMKRAKLNQREFADLIGVHPQLISNIERNISPFPPGRAGYISRYVSMTELREAFAKDKELLWTKDTKRK